MVQVFDVFLQPGLLLVQLLLLGLELRDLCLQILHLLQHLLSLAPCVLPPGLEEDETSTAVSDQCFKSADEAGLEAS